MVTIPGEIAALAIVPLGARMQRDTVVARDFGGVVRVRNMRFPEEAAVRVERLCQAIGEFGRHVVAAKDQLPGPIYRGYRPIHAAQQAVRDRQGSPP